MRIFLIRHAETDYNTAGLTQGSSDIELNDNGHAQSKKLASFLANTGVKQIFCSDLKRAIQTAAHIQEACACPLTLSPLLRERNMGKLEGVTLQDLRQAYDNEVASSGLSMFDVRPGDAESAYDVMERAKLFFNQTAISVDTAIVTHGMMAETILAHLIGATAECTRSFQFNNASLTELELFTGVWVLKRYNDTHFLG